MTDIEERGRKFSLALTSAIFLIFFILCLVIRIKPKETYKAITIQLDSTPVIKDKPKTTTKKSEVAKKSESAKTENKSEKNSQHSWIHSFTSRYNLFHPYYMESTVEGGAQDLDKKIRTIEGDRKTKLSK